MSGAVPGQRAAQPAGRAAVASSRATGRALLAGGTHAAEIRFDVRGLGRWTRTLDEDGGGERDRFESDNESE